MELGSFYKLIENFAWTTGSKKVLDAVFEDYLETIKLPGGKQCLIGILVPTIEEFKNELLIAKRTIQIVNDKIEVVQGPDYKDKAENLIKKLYGPLLEQDIRYQAIQHEADGLVEVRLHSTIPRLYSGIPVKENLGPLTE